MTESESTSNANGDEILTGIRDFVESLDVDWEADVHAARDVVDDSPRDLWD